MLVEIKSLPNENGRPAVPFDLFILNDQSDYECYIRSTEMLDQRIGLDCAFLANPKLAHYDITSFSQDMADFINPDGGVYREYQFIIDNTMFPWFNNRTTREMRPDLHLDVSFTTTYKVSMEFTSIIYVGVAIAGVLFLLLIIMICLYKKHKKLYSLAADRRMKRTLSVGDMNKSKCSEE